MTRFRLYLRAKGHRLSFVFLVVVWLTQVCALNARDLMTLDETNLDFASPRLFHIDVVDSMQAARTGSVPFFGLRQSSQIEALTSRALAVGSIHVSRWLLPNAPWNIVATLGSGLETLAMVPLLYVPFGYPWMHEEWHRAVLAKNGVASFNAINTFPFFQTLIPVDQVLDNDLVRLKATAPRDLIRLEAAGYESQTYKTFSAVRDSFAAASAQVSGLGYLGNFLSVLQNSLYFVTATLPQGDEQTRKVRATEGTNIALRDFTGLDFTGWVYDLFRPTEPYSSRGTHPSGVGIDRYRLFSQLSVAEQSYLELQSKLSFLNFVNPGLIGINYFDFTVDGRLLRANAFLQHYLTSFGSQVNLVALLADGPATVEVVLQANTNSQSTFPGLNVEMYRFPFVALGLTFKGTVRGSVWLQPENLSYTTPTPTPGGSLGADLFVPVSPGQWVVVTVDAKTVGWQAAVLDQDAGLNAGFGWAFEF